MASLLPAPLRKLKAYAAQTDAALIAALKRAQRDVRKEIAFYAASKSAATNAKTRDELYDEVEARYSALAEGIDAQLLELTGKVGRMSHDFAVGDITNAGESPTLRYDPARNKRYFDLIRPGNAKNLAAVFTDKMSADTVRSLRTAFVDVFRQGTVEGLTATQMQKALQERWDKLAGDDNAFRFVDRSGRRWDNARYLTMLVETNAQRVAVESYIDTLTESGFSLARISDDGGVDCPICGAWEGRIVQIAGKSKKWPTYEEARAAGVFHPNCTHRLEYVDETADADEIARQGKLGKPPAGADSEFMQGQKDRLDEGRYVDQGMSQEDARRAVTADRLERAIRSGTFSDEAAEAARELSADYLDALRADGLPSFATVKAGEKTGRRRGGAGGVVRVPRGATARDVIDALGYTGTKPETVQKPAQQAVKQPDKQPDKQPAKIVAETRADAIRADFAKNGLSPSVAKEAAKTPVSVLEKVEPPETVADNAKASKNGLYDGSRIRMSSNPDSWGGNPLVWHHEMGHHVDNKLGLTKWIGVHCEPSAGLAEALRKDEAAWKAQAGRVLGDKWRQRLKGVENWMPALVDYGKEIGVEDYRLACEDDKHRIAGLLDAIQGATGGLYGWGHSKAYAKRRGVRELVANLYRASVKDWKEYEIAFPEAMRYIKTQVGL